MVISTKQINVDIDTINSWRKDDLKKVNVEGEDIINKFYEFSEYKEFIELKTPIFLNENNINDFYDNLIKELETLKIKIIDEEKIKKERLVEYIIENFADAEGYIDISDLNFGKSSGIDISRLKINGDIEK